MTQLTLTAAQGGSLRVEAETALAPRIVTSEAATRAEPKAVSAAAPARLVIIGNGMVSHRLCQTLASFNQQRYAITVFSDEGLPAYDRVHVSDVLAGRPPTSLMLASPAWYRDHAIDLRLGEPIIGIDLQQKTILTANGQRASYDKLVIASGSAPLLPAIKIDDWNGVFVLRTLDDVERMQAVAATAHRAVIIGGGVQGLETAAALQRPGLELTILEAGGHLMNRQLDATAAALLKEQLESRGIRVRLQTRPTGLARGDSGHKVALSNEETLDADFVVITTGVRPRDNLARWCLRTGQSGGYSVDQFLQTSDPNVYAIGECASWQDQPIAAGPSGHAMAECLARTLLDQPSSFRMPTPSLRLSICGLSIGVAGEVVPDADPPVTARGPGWIRSLQLKRGILVRAVSVGVWDEWSQAEEAIHRGAAITPAQLRQFLDGGRIFVDGRAATVSQPQSSPQSSPYSGPYSAPHSGPHRVHPVASAAAAVLSLMLVAVLAVGRPLLELTGPQALAAWNQLLRDPMQQQITGFGVLGLGLIAWFLTSRRLVAHLRSRVRSWRLLHIVLGGLTVAALVAHTGLRLGRNANLVLSLVFLGLAATGGFATFLRSGRSLSRHLLSGARLLHKVLLWPALALLGLHVLAVYYF